MDSESMAMLFSNRTGLVIDQKKLRNYHAKKQQSSHSAGAFDAMTPAEQAINKLTSCKTVSFAYLVANVTVKKDFVTTYTGGKGKKTRSSPKLDITFESNVTSNGISCLLILV